MTPLPNDRKLKVQCKHCGNIRTGNRPRGLCWTCYYTPSVRESYPPEKSAAEIKHESPEAPCPYPPKSPERLAYLEARAKDGLGLFHPGDRGGPY